MENLAIQAFKSNNFFELERIAKLILKDNPNNLFGLKALSIAYKDSKRVKEGLELMEYISKIYPNDMENLLNFAKALHFENYYKRALEIFLKAYNLNPKNLEATIFLIDSYIFLNMPNFAIKILEKALINYPNSEALYNRLGTVYRLLKDLDNSIFYHKKALLLITEQKIKQNISFDNNFNKNYENILFKLLHDLYEIKAFAIAGTALGLYRDGKLLPFDKDIDIGLEFKDMEKAINYLSNSGWIEYASSNGLINPRVFKHKESGLIADLCGYKRELNYFIGGFWIDYFDMSLNRVTKYSEFELEICELKTTYGVIWELKNKQEYLSSLYGNWQVEDRDFDSIVMGKCLIGFSKLTEIYAIDKIYSSYKSGKFQRAIRIIETCLHHCPKDEFYLKILNRVKSAIS